MGSAMKPEIVLKTIREILALKQRSGNASFVAMVANVSDVNICKPLFQGFVSTLQTIMTNPLSQHISS
jgi:hypothetical protein